MCHKDRPYDLTVAYRVSVSLCGDHKDVGIRIQVKGFFKVCCICIMKRSVNKAKRYRAGFTGNNLRIISKRVGINSCSFCTHPVRT